MFSPPIKDSLGPFGYYESFSVSLLLVNKAEYFAASVAFICSIMAANVADLNLIKCSSLRHHSFE